MRSGQFKRFWDWFGKSNCPGARFDLTVNFHHGHFIDPTNCPWVSEDGIYVECVIRRLNEYQILKNELPISLLPVEDDLVTICAALTNLKPTSYVTRLPKPLSNVPFFQSKCYYQFAYIRKIQYIYICMHSFPNKSNVVLCPVTPTI